MQRTRPRSLRQRYEKPVDGLGTNKLPAFEKDFLVVQRRREHRCWAIFFLFIATAVGFTRLLPGFQFVEAPVLALFPNADDEDIVRITHGIFGLSVSLFFLSLYFSCRSVSAMQSQASYLMFGIGRDGGRGPVGYGGVGGAVGHSARIATSIGRGGAGGIENIGRPGIMGGSVRRFSGSSGFMHQHGGMNDVSVSGMRDHLGGSLVEKAGTEAFRGGRWPGGRAMASPGGRILGGRGRSSTRTPNSMNNGSSGSPISSPGSGGSIGFRGSAGGTNHTGGRRSSSRGRAPRNMRKSSLGRLLASSPAASRYSPTSLMRHRSKEVASLSPAGRALDVDLIDRRSGIDNEASLSRYLASFRQQREIERQRSDYRTALDPAGANIAFMRSGRNQRYRVARRDSSHGEGGSSGPGGTSRGEVGGGRAAGALGRGRVLDLEEEGINAEREYKSMGILDYVDNWESELRKVFARALKEGFLAQLHLNTEELAHKGIDLQLLEHHENVDPQPPMQRGFSKMRDLMKAQAQRLYQERIQYMRNDGSKQAKSDRARILNTQLQSRLNFDFDGWLDLTLRQLLPLLAHPVRAHNRHREARGSASNIANSSAAGNGGVFRNDVAPGASLGGNMLGGAPVAGAAALGGFGASNLLPPASTFGATGSAGNFAAVAALASRSSSDDYERLFYLFFLSGRKDYRTGKLVELVEERQRLEKYLLVHKMPEQSRGYVLKRIIELTRDRRFGAMNWPGGGAWKGRPWTPSSNLPSDVQIVLHMFCMHMEHHLRVNNFASEYRIGGDRWARQQFDAGPELGLLVTRDQLDRPHVQVILEGQEIPIRPGKVNVFEALAVFLWLVNERHDGFLKEIDILKGMCLDEVFDDNRGLGGLQHAI